jgi:hypothetical protein
MIAIVRTVFVTTYSYGNGLRPPPYEPAPPPEGEGNYQTVKTSTWPLSSFTCSEGNGDSGLA